MHINSYHFTTHTQALYPTLTRFGLDQIVEDNASPHNNDDIRASHRRHNVRIVGYTATEADKEEIKALIREQCQGYRREQDKKAQMTKQTRELDRLPAWFVFHSLTTIHHEFAVTHNHLHSTHTHSHPTYTPTQASELAGPQPD